MSYVTKKLQKMWYDRHLYLLLIPGFAATALFVYWPMYGILIAFKNFSPRLGILKSPWADNFGLANFTNLLKDPDFFRALKNTLIINSVGFLLGTFMVILFALLINEIRYSKFKRTIQTFVYLPHFLSWVILGSIIFGLLSSVDGAVAKIVEYFGGTMPQIYTNPKYFRPMLYISGLIKGTGFGTIIYLAAIAGINPELYEASYMDGAGRFRQAWYITLPGMKSTIVLLAILGLPGILTGGPFDQVFNLITPQTYIVGDIIPTLVFRKLFSGMQGIAPSAAIGLAFSFIGIGLILLVNKISTLFGQDSII